MVLQQPTILLVEDDADDQRLFQWAMRKSGLSVDVRLAPDGDAAIRFLSGPPERLFLILSDIHLPRKSGWDVLQWIRQHERLFRLPVLMWTSLPTVEGAARARRLGADSYFPKPTDAPGYRRLIHRIGDYLRD